MRARRFRPRTGPGNSKEHYRDFSQVKPPAPVLKAYCCCPGGDAIGAGPGRSCLVHPGRQKG